MDNPARNPFRPRAGHFSAADRYRYLRELAFDFAWLLDVFGKAK